MAKSRKGINTILASNAESDQSQVLYAGLGAGGVLIYASRAYQKALRLLIHGSQLSPTQFGALWVSYTVVSPMTGGNIARLMGIEHHTVSRALDGLEERKLIERKRDKKDKRNWRVILTLPGKQLVEAYLPSISNFIRDVFMRNLSDDEARSFSRIALKLHSNCISSWGEDTNTFRKKMKELTLGLHRIGTS